MKKFIVSIIILATTNVFAQDTTKYWAKGGFVSLSFNQLSVTNWAAGGENAISVVSVVNLFANYKKEKTTWDNTLDMGYGLIQLADNPLRKNEDKIELNSKYGRLAKGDFYYAALINMKTQFANGYNFPNDSVIISHLAAPAYITVALGMDYKPNDWFSLFVSPATGKYTIVNDQKLADAGAYGVEAAKYDTSFKKISSGKKFRAEFGAYLRMKLQKDLTKNVNLSTTLNLFNNYTDKVTKNRGNIDIDWQTMISMKAGKYLTTSVFTHVIYDHDIDIPTYETINGVKTVKSVGPKTQFKELIGVGLSYKF